MNFKTIGVVISREYTTRVKKKSFLITTFLVPVLFAAMCCIPALIMLFNKDDDKIFAVVDTTGCGVVQRMDSTKELQIADYSAYQLDSLKTQLDDAVFCAILEINKDNEGKIVAQTYSNSPIGASCISELEYRIADAMESYNIEQQGIENLREIIDQIRPDIDITTFVVDEQGEDKLSSAGLNTGLSMFLGIIIFMFVTMFSSSVMQSVIEEKQSKVVEVLLSSVRSLELMFGKIIGVALVALTQFFLWIALTSAIVSAVFAVVGKDELMGPATQSVEQMSTMADVPEGAASSMDMFAGAAEMQNPTQIQVLMQSFAGMDLKLILGSFFVFFIFGYLLYASVFAAIGSAVENAEDSQQLQIPITVPLMIGYFIALYSWNAPDSTLALWGSMIPFTSPIVMLARIPFGVPVWQLALSIGILVLTFMLMAWLSAKIYRVGILTSGKKATWKDLWRWLRQK